MHVISEDLLGSGMKTKAHWNSFSTEYFISLDQVLKALTGPQGHVVVDTMAMNNLKKQTALRLVVTKG
eukprot:gene18707-25230_t